VGESVVDGVGAFVDPSQKEGMFVESLQIVFLIHSL
jgi:hypothetical protein